MWGNGIGKEVRRSREERDGGRVVDARTEGKVNRKRKKHKHRR